MRQGTKYFILLYGLIETFVFTGNIFGWTALHHMLRQEGIYEHLCEVPQEKSNGYGQLWNMSVTDILMAAAIGDVRTENLNAGGYPSNASFGKYSNITGPGNPRQTCEAQDRLLNLAFTVGSFCIGSTAFAWGFLLNIWGLRYVRLFINGLVTAGTILLSLTEKETSYLIFPSLILMCLAGVPLRLANMQIADLFPEHRSTIITLYSGAFSASASVFVFIKYGFDAGLPWEWACFILVVLSVLMLPVTLFVLPADRVQEPEKQRHLFTSVLDRVNEVAGITPSVWGTFALVQGSPDLAKKTLQHTFVQSSSTGDDKNRSIEKCKDSKADTPEIPLRKSLLSVSFLLHQYWFCWLLLYTIIYVGTLHLWSERTFEDPKDGAFFSEIYGLFQVTGLFLAPLGGLFMDWSLQKASQESDPEKRSLQVLRSCFWPMALTTLTEAVAQGCKFFNSELAIYVSIVFVTLLRAFFIAIGTAFLRIRFPAHHFGRLLGIMSTMSAVFTLLQFPLFLWESASPSSVLHVNIFDSVCLLMAFVHPLLLLVTPLQKYFIQKEKNQSTDRTTE